MHQDSDQWSIRPGSVSAVAPTRGRTVTYLDYISLSGCAVSVLGDLIRPPPGPENVQKAPVVGDVDMCGTATWSCAVEVHVEVEAYTRQ